MTLLYQNRKSELVSFIGFRKYKQQILFHKQGLRSLIKEYFNGGDSLCNRCQGCDWLVSFDRWPVPPLVGSGSGRPWRGTSYSLTKHIDSFEAPPFNLFAPFHLNDVLVPPGRGRGVIQLQRERYQGGRRVLTNHGRALGNHLVGGLCDTFYQFFMPIPLDVTPLKALYAPDSSAQENMLPLW